MHNRSASGHRQDGPPAGQRDSKPSTARSPAQQPAPRMPHERDESADSQRSDEPSAQRMGRLAHDDVERGLVDTDKGPPLDETYEKYRDDAPEGDKKFSP